MLRTPLIPLRLEAHFAFWLVSNGVDLATVQRLMAHQNANTMQCYAHLRPGALEDAALRSSKLLSSVAKKKDEKAISSKA